MRKLILAVMAVVLFCAAPVLAAEEAKKAPAGPGMAAAAQAQLDAAKQEKEVLISNITNMRNQELKVAVLQQLLNEEIGKLRNIQAVFCDQYKLDVDKFRNGLYRYDDKQGKFIEVPSEPEKKNP